MEPAREEDEIKGEVRFFTKSPDPTLQVAPTPFYVPLSLSRAGLSQVINHLLSLETPQPFDFIIGNELLRTTLQDYKIEKKIPKDDVLTIEYLPALPPPKFDSEITHDDWISSISGGNSDFILTGCYDGHARIWDSSKNCIFLSPAQIGPIKGISWLASPSSALTFVTANQDHSLTIFEIATKGNSLVRKVICRGHTEGVESVAADPSGGKFCSGSWDSTIRLWEAASTQDDSVDTTEPEKPQKKKRKAVTEHNTFTKQSLAVLDKHTQCVSCVAWPLAERAYSGSWDHTVREWDVESGANTTVLAGKTAAQCIAYSRSSGLLATGHAEPRIHLWDPRARAGALVQQHLQSHIGWVSGVRWHPHRENILVSCSHDGEVKLWDIRTKIPLYTIEAEESSEKLLAVDWKGDDEILSGGESGKLRVHKIVGFTS